MKKSNKNTCQPVVTYDTIKLLGKKITEEGYLTARAVIARAGIQQYFAKEIGYPSDNPDEIILVERPESEVFNEESMRSFEGKPVTNDHPPEMLNVDNIGDYQVGYVSKEVLRDGDKLVTEIVVTDKNTIRDIQNGKKELSNGYRCIYEFDESVRGITTRSVSGGVRSKDKQLGNTFRGGKPNGREALMSNNRRTPEGKRLGLYPMDNEARKGCRDLDPASGISRGQEHADSVRGTQTQIRGNHIAIVSKGRAGSECRIMDRALKNIEDPKNEASHSVKALGGFFVNKVLESKTMDNEEKKTEDTVEELQKTIKDLKAQLAQKDASLEEMKGQKDELNLANKEKDTKEKEANDSFNLMLDNAIEQKFQALEVMKKIDTNDYCYKNKTALDIQKDIIKKRDVNIVLDEKCNNYIQGRYDAIVESLAKNSTQQANEFVKDSLSVESYNYDEELETKDLMDIKRKNFKD